jgi:hypothetical protein
MFSDRALQSITVLEKEGYGGSPRKVNSPSPCGEEETGDRAVSAIDQQSVID